VGKKASAAIDACSRQLVNLNAHCFAQQQLIGTSTYFAYTEGVLISDNNQLISMEINENRMNAVVEL